MPYAESRLAAGVDLWRSTTAGAAEQRILPDGCLDLVHDGDRVVVAGPDTAARLHRSPDPCRFVGLRLHGGRGPALLGVPADRLADRTVDLADLCGDRTARVLADLLVHDPAALAGRASAVADPLGDRLLALLGPGRRVDAAADALGLSARQLGRRCRGAFGYGPQHLARVLRLQRAVAAGDAGAPWAEVAATSGFADQAHLAREVRHLAGTTPTALRRERDVRSVQDGGPGDALASTP